MKRWYLLIAVVGALGLFVLLAWVNGEYSHLGNVISSWAVLLLASFAFVSIWLSNKQTRQHREDEKAKEERDKKERLLNEIIEWATEVRRYGSIVHITDQLSFNQMMRADRFFTLKYNGKKFLIAVKKRAIGNDLQGLLSGATKFLDDNWRELDTVPNRRAEIGKELDKIGEIIIEKAEKLLIKQSI